MKLAGICLVSGQVEVLAEFYSQLLKLSASGNKDHTYFEFDNIHLSICSESVEDDISPESMINRGRSKTILEFDVKDIDEMYMEINNHAIKIVKAIKTETWGVRSFWIEDPDGNIINCCSTEKI